MRNKRGSPVTLTMIAEVVAFEAGKSVADVLASRRQYDVWLRRVCIWLARHVGGQTLDEIGAAFGRSLNHACGDVREAVRVYRDDAAFRDFAAIAASALVTL